MTIKTMAASRIIPIFTWPRRAVVLKTESRVIVAGGGDFGGNPIAEQTRALGAYAYRTLRSRGYEAGEIQYLTAFGPLDPGAKFDEEGTGWGWKEAGRVKAAETVLPTTCKMERPN